jgi:membrane protein DedA with SNARE-associated domain
MLHWVAHWVRGSGYLGIGLLMAIQNVVLPLPSELIMPLAGFLSAQGRMTLWGAIVAGTVGTVLGAMPVYMIGRAFGEERVAQWIERHGKWLLLHASDVRRADRRFQQRGEWAVFFAQLLPGVRGLIALPAGVARMNVSLFLLANFVGSAIWCTVLALVGQQLGAHFQRIHRWLMPLTWVLGGVLVVVIVRWVIRRRRAVGHQVR